MAIKNLIARGVGFSPGSVKFIPTLGFSIGVVVVSHTQLKALVLDLFPGMGTTMMFNGNTLPISIITSTPTVAPPGDKGVCFKVSGGVLTIYAWNGSSWVS